eukprot:TRINITY_DN6950_c0_g1_i1.p1 TRINITY_DN6950_c0_g1~~TRINITY_DN6950_c0_g1_i1.p1  ORF type:complete len:436 (+),score=145.37 TRINITY_DN6950_c0_g1_i1:1427-2734(+)
MKRPRLGRRRPLLLLVLGLLAGGVLMLSLLWLSSTVPEPDPAAAATQPQPSQPLADRVRQLEDELAATRAKHEQAEAALRDARLRLSDQHAAGQPGSSDEGSDQLGSSGIALLIFCHNRPAYLNRTLASVFRHLPPDHFPLIVSQDGEMTEVRDVVRQYAGVIHLQRWDRSLPPKESPGERDSYYHIAQNYAFGLRHVFDVLKFAAVIIIEDDLELSPDFFDYFAGTLSLLRSDPTLMCASAWNDNGQAQFVADPYALYRSDFFPGLGWMMLRTLWQELGSRWPRAYWDDWLREPAQRKDRACIRPEVSRTITFGREGSSAGQYFDQYLAPMRLNDQPIRWTRRDLSYLRKPEYDASFAAMVAAARPVAFEQLETARNETLLVRYENDNHFVQLAERIGIMPDSKAGVPRTAYKGVVHFRWNSNIVLLVPASFAR